MREPTTAGVPVIDAEETAPDPTATTDALLSHMSIGVAWGAASTLEGWNAAAGDLLGLGPPGAAQDWVALIADGDRLDDHAAQEDAHRLGASAWTRRDDHPGGAVEVLYVSLSRMPPRWLALIRSATGRPGGQRRHEQPSPADGAAVTQLAQALAGARTVDEVTSVIRLLAPSLVGARAVALGWNDPHTGAFRRVAEGYGHHITDERGRSQGLDDLLRRVMDDQGPGRVAVTGLLAGPRGTDDRVSAVGIPLRGHHPDNVGALILVWESEPTLSRPDQVAIGDLLADAIRRTRALTHAHLTSTTLQDLLLPTSLTDAAGITVTTRFVGADGDVGGDFYDVVHQDEVSFLMIGDVAGHGLEAARTMGKLRWFLRAALLDRNEIGAAVTVANRVLVAESDGELATCALLSWRPESASLHAVLAGHVPPLVARVDSPFEVLDADPQPPLGSIRHHVYTATEVPVGSGATVVGFTDGLVEQPGTPLRAAIARLARALSEEVDGDGVEAIARYLDSRIAVTPRRDDTAIVVARLEHVTRVEAPD